MYSMPDSQKGVKNGLFRTWFSKGFYERGGRNRKVAHGQEGALGIFDLGFRGYFHLPEESRYECHNFQCRTASLMMKVLSRASAFDISISCF